MQLRAHHIYCVPFLKPGYSEQASDRGEDFIRVVDKIRQTIHEESDKTVEVIWGTDELCQACPFCRDNSCQSPDGDEKDIRKFDSIILKGLGVSAGTILPVSEWRRLIEQKSPLDFCRRCTVRPLCDVERSDAFEGAGA